MSESDKAAREAAEKKQKHAVDEHSKGNDEADAVPPLMGPQQGEFSPFAGSTTNVEEALKARVKEIKEQPERDKAAAEQRQKELKEEAAHHANHAKERR